MTWRGCEVRLIPTAGVEVVDGGYRSPELGIAIPESHPEARALILSHGLASETAVVRIGGGSLPIPAWWLYQSARLHGRPPGMVARAALQVLRGMTGWLLLAAGLLVAAGAGLSSLAGIAGVLLLLVLSVVVHEVGHVVALATTPGAVGYLVTRGARCELVRRRLPPANERIVVAAGPLAPLALAVATVPVLAVAPLLWSAWLVVALGHAATLVVPVGDGRALRAAATGR